MRVISRIVVSLGLVMSFSACGPTVMYSDEKKVPEPWSYELPVTFDFEVNDTLNPYNIILEVDYEKEFQYQNLYTKLLTKFPNGLESEDIISLDIRKKSGESNGECGSKTCVVPFLIQQQVYFETLGEHSLSIFQHSRQDSLANIIEMKLKLVKVEV